jgi:hypothetical protein
MQKEQKLTPLKALRSAIKSKFIFCPRSDVLFKAKFLGDPP